MGDGQGVRVGVEVLLDTLGGAGKRDAGWPGLWAVMGPDWPG
jgi:hypothetical protein